MPRLTLAAVASLLLAGCTGGGQPTQDEHAGHDMAAGAEIPAPEWQVGDWWTWSSPQQQGGYRHAVSGESGGDWVVDTDSQDIAFFNARSDISMLGKVRKSDLAGSQGNERVEFFRFPLRAHTNWTTMWDGAMAHIHVMSVEDGVAHIEASRHDGTRYAHYTYEAESEHFGFIAFYNADGSEVAFESSVADYGSGFADDLVRWDLQTMVDLHGAIPAQQALQYKVPASVTDVYIEGRIDCVSGALAVATGPPQGPAEERGYSAHGNCPLQKEDAYVASSAPAQEETWGLVAAAVPTTAGTLDLTVWLRTLVAFKPGAAPPV